MTDYKTIRGKKIKSFATDLGNDQAEGQIFYQDTANEFKTVVATAAFHAGAPLSTARGYAGGGGTQTAGIYFGGAPDLTATENYNGTGWSTGGNLNTGRETLGGAGTQTAALAFGGNKNPDANSDDSEEYNGTSWSEGNNLNTAKQQLPGAGTQTAAITSTGYDGTNVLAETEEYNGTSWSEVTDNPTGRIQASIAGSQTAALFAFGATNTPGGTLSSATQTYDGTNWTNESGTVNTARRLLGMVGSQTSAIAAGGLTAPGATANAESWDGTSWTEGPNLANARYGTQGSFGASSKSATFVGGKPASSLTEEYNVTVNTITAGAWSAGGTIPFSSNQKNGSGILTAAFVSGGETPPGAVVDDTAEYNGTSWTAGGDINSARGDIMAGGTQTAGLIFGGFQNVPDPNFLFEETEEYNGTSWSEQNDMPTGAYSGSGTGTQTAAFACNMYIGSPGERSNVTYEYDGTNWSNGGNTAETTNSRSAVGTLTAGLAVGGRPAPSTFIDETELYDGTSWTAGVDMISIFSAGGQTSKGTQTDCMIFGSPKSPVNTDAFKTDGTTWFTQPSLGSYQNNGTGTSTAGLAFGIGTSSQEFAGETTALNLKTITDS